MLAYYLHNLDPIIFRIYDNVGPRWYGLAYVAAFVSSYFLFLWLSKRGYADLHEHLDDTNAPPGPVDSWLGEVVVHGADIRRPLGIAYAPPIATLIQVADFYKNSDLLIGSKTRIAGLQLTATDAPWSHGSGPEVSGPMLSLVQAMTGRRAALADLSGDGLDPLRSRM